MTATEQLISKLQLSIEDCIEKEKWLKLASVALIDYLGCLYSGLSNPLNQKKLSSFLDGDRSSLFTQSGSIQALVYGYAAHYNDLDDVQAYFRGHPSSVIYSALLAVIDEESRDDVLLAYIQGVELAGRLGKQLQPQHIDQGWHSTATIGTLAAAAAIAVLKKLDSTTFAHLLSLASSQASGFLYQEGTDAKPLQAGFAARNAVLAYQLAESGFTAYQAIFSSEKGWSQTLSSSSLSQADLLDHWLQPAQIETPGLWFKIYPFCSAANAGFDLAQTAYRQGITSADLSEIHIHFSADGDRALTHQQPKTKLEGKFSIEYLLWLALSEGRVKTADFTEEAIPAAFLAFSKKIQRHHDLKASQTERPARLRLIAKNGHIIFNQIQRQAKGSPDNPYDLEELRLKFERLTQGQEKIVYQEVMGAANQQMKSILEKFRKGTEWK